jgi:hypothetical protein
MNLPAGRFLFWPVLFWLTSNKVNRLKSGGSHGIEKESAVSKNFSYGRVGGFLGNAGVYCSP